MLTTSKHRAAWDTTISAPKSVSLGALVEGDGRIREAHRESVNEALKEFENICKRVAAAHPRVTISVRTGRGTSSLSNRLLQTAV